MDVDTLIENLDKFAQEIWGNPNERFLKRLEVLLYGLEIMTMTNDISYVAMEERDLALFAERLCNYIIDLANNVETKRSLSTLCSEIYKVIERIAESQLRRISYKMALDSCIKQYLENLKKCENDP